MGAVCWAAQSTPRYGCVAVRLADGRAMVVGGRGSTGFLATSEVFDPATGRWAGLAKMQEARYLFACAALPAGRVGAGGGCAVVGCGVGEGVSKT